MPIYYPDKIEHNNPNLKLLDDKWINYEVETVSRTIYISNAGSDTTGDGSITTPYATFTKTLSTIKKIIGSGVTITLYAVAGTYSLTADDLTTISQFSGAGSLTIQGELALVESGFTMGAAEALDPLTHAVSGGNTATWTTDQWKFFYFLKSGTSYFPITNNTNTQIGKTTTATGIEIYEIVSIINTTAGVSSSIDLMLKRLHIKLPSGSVGFDTNAANSLSIEECLFYGLNTTIFMSNSKTGVTRRSSFYRIAINTPNNTVMGFNYYYLNVSGGVNIALNNSSNSITNSVIENPFNSSNVYGILFNSRTNLLTSSTNIKFLNTINCIGIGVGGVVLSSLDVNSVILINSSYLFRKGSTTSDYASFRFTLPYVNILGTPTVRWFFDPMYEFVNPVSGRNIQITGLIYPEYEANQKYTWNNNTSGNVVVGTTAQNYAIEIDYVIARGTLRETGKLKLTNAADTLIDRVQEFDDCGITLGKLISGTDIQLTYVVTDAVDNASVTFMQVKRVMLTPLTI